MSEKQQFEIFQETYNKNYGTEEERKKRFKIFKENLVEIKELMASEGSGGSVVYGVGPFTDFTRKYNTTYNALSRTRECCRTFKFIIFVFTRKLLGIFN